MRLNVLDVRDVAELQLCCGCGACAGAKPDDIEMVDTHEFGRRPRLKHAERSGAAARGALAVCPGVGVSHTFNRHDPRFMKGLASGWGPVLELWEGFAGDRELRYSGSSGGAASALALYCIERGGMHGVLHIAAREDVPYLNKTVLSRTRAEILGATGSRYSPASPCEGLPLVKNAPAPCVMIGKPCDIAGAAKSRALDAGLDERLGLTIAIFCAGTPTTKGTLEMLSVMGISDPGSVTGVRYRGNGWPGKAAASAAAGGEEIRRELSYEESWGGILQKHRQWRCYVCADHTGEFADISVGDPWVDPMPRGDPGRSLVVVRTERGRRILGEAMRAGYLKLEPAAAGILEASQPALLAGRGATWGRLLGLRLLGVPRPRYRGFPMFRFWVTRLNMRAKSRSVYGTFKRVYTKRLKQRHAVEAFEPARPPAVLAREPVGAAS